MGGRLTLAPPLPQVCLPWWWLCPSALPAPKDTVHPASTWASRGGQWGSVGLIGFDFLDCDPGPRLLWAFGPVVPCLSLSFPDYKRPGLDDLRTVYSGISLV